LKWLSKGLLIRFSYFILNISNTFYMYSPQDHVNIQYFLSLFNLIPKIFFATPKSFTKNELDKFILSTLISYMSCPFLFVGKHPKHFMEMISQGRVGTCNGC